MTKYYFVSYLMSQDATMTYGCCVMAVKNKSLKEIAAELASMNGWDKPVVITCLKDLSKKEYEMLKGENQ